MDIFSDFPALSCPPSLLKIYLQVVMHVLFSTLWTSREHKLRRRSRFTTIDWNLQSNWYKLDP